MLKIAFAKNNINATTDQMHQLADLTDGYSFFYSAIQAQISPVWSTTL